MKNSDNDEKQMEQGEFVQTLDKNTPVANQQKFSPEAHESRQKSKRGRPVALSLEDFQKFLRGTDFFWNPLSNVQIAKQLNVSEATIRRLRKKLKY